MSNYTFGISSPKEFYGLFIESVNDYSKDVINIGKAISVAMFAFHLTDWIYQERISKTGEKFSKKKLGDLRKSLNCGSLNIMHDIINGSKHFILDDGRDKAVKNTSTYEGDYDPDEYDDEDYDVSELLIELKNGTIISFLSEVEKVEIFWTNYFKDL